MAYFELLKLKYDCLYSVNNKIGDGGCVHLSKGNWPLLKYISLSKKSYIKWPITLEMMDVLI